MHDLNEKFVYRKRVAYHETDAMGIVHHSNHIKYFEEARVEWLRARGLLSIHSPYGPLSFAVVHLEASYRQPARFDDELEIHVQAKLEGLRIHFHYSIWSVRLASEIAEGKTVLVSVNDQLRPARLPRLVAEVFAKEPWDKA